MAIKGGAGAQLRASQPVSHFISGLVNLGEVKQRARVRVEKKERERKEREKKKEEEEKK